MPGLGWVGSWSEVTVMLSREGLRACACACACGLLSLPDPTAEVSAVAVAVAVAVVVAVASMYSWDWEKESGRGWGKEMEGSRVMVEPSGKVEAESWWLKGGWPWRWARLVLWVGGWEEKRYV